jgi:hypothetical protein
MIIEDLAQYIEDNGLGIQAQNIFIGDLPLDKNDCVSLVYQVSPDRDKVLDYYTQDIDIWSKNKSASLGYSKLLSIANLLHGKANYTLGDFHVYLSHQIGTIFDNDVDAQNNKLYKLSLRFIYRVALIS